MIPHWLLDQMQKAEAAGQRDLWLDLHWWCWRRWLLLRMVPRKIFDHDDTVVRDAAKLVDVAIRDHVRRIHHMLQETGTPAIPVTPQESVRSQSKRRRCTVCFHVYNVASCSCCQSHPLGPRQVAE